MFLSLLKLNLKNRFARKDISNSYEMHRTIWQAFPSSDQGGAARVLFRLDIEPRTGLALVLVQSILEPDWTKLPEDYVKEPALCKEINLQLRAGMLLRFRLRANPTKRQFVRREDHNKGNVPLGKRVGLLTEEEQFKWLERKAKTAGFRVDKARVRVTDRGRFKNGKPGAAGSHLAVDFEGILTVTNEQLFLQAVENGIGSAKGYGYGLMSLARVEG